MPGRCAPSQVKICSPVNKPFLASLPGSLRISQDIPSTHHKLLSLALRYLPFASRFPLPHFTLAILFALFSFRPLFPFAFSLLVFLRVGLFVTVAQDNTKLCDFSNTNNNDFLSTLIAPITDAESCEIYAALLHHPFLFKGKPTQCSRGSKKDFWRRCRGDLRQVKSRFDS